jgi:uncharacterized membrane protein YdjX (TVP38/TMEM64 family)
MADPVDRGIALSNRRAALPYIAVGVLVVIAILVFGREAGRHVASIEQWITDLGPAGYVVFVGLLVVGTSLLVPESLFGVAAGAVFGIRAGFITLFVGNVLAALVQFALAHRLLRGRIQKMLATRPQLAAIQQAVLQDETRLQLLLRLTPLNPAILSYVFSAAGVRLPGFVLACVALFPHLLMEVYLGRALHRLTRLGAGTAPHSFAHEAATFGGLLVSVVVLFIVSRIARKAIERTGYKF